MGFKILVIESDDPTALGAAMEFLAGRTVPPATTTKSPTSDPPKVASPPPVKRVPNVTKPRKPKKEPKKSQPELVPRKLPTNSEASSDRTRRSSHEIDAMVIDAVSSGPLKIGAISTLTGISWNSVSNSVSRLISKRRLIDGENGIEVHP